jgi:hypothetical protein
VEVKNKAALHYIYLKDLGNFSKAFSLARRCGLTNCRQLEQLLTR